MKYLSRDKLKQLFECLNNEDMKTVYKIIGHEEFDSFDIENLTIEDEEKIVRAILSKINRDDFDYIAIDLKNASVLSDFVSIVQDSNLCMEIVKKYKDYLSSFELRCAILDSKNVDFIKTCIENYKEYGLYSSDLADLLIASNDTEFIKKYFENYEKYDLDLWREKLLLATKNLEYIKKWIIYDINLFRDNLKDAIKIFNSDETKLCELVKEIFPYRRVEIIKASNNPDFIKKCILDEEFQLKTSQKVELTVILNDEDLTKKIILNTKDLKDTEFYTLINGLDRRKRISCLNSLSDMVDEKLIIEYRKNTDDYEFIKNNIEFFMKKEKVQETQISLQKEYLIRMYEQNNEVMGKIDFKILDTKYVNALGLDRINQISCYPNIQAQVLGLNELQLKVFSKCIKSCKSTKWTPLAQAFLNNYEQYHELIENISDFEIEEIDFEKINIIIQDENIFEIKTLKDVENFSEIRKAKCDNWIQSSDIEQRKQAVLEKIYGQSIDYSKVLIEKYGKNIDEIQDEDLKCYIISIKLILQLDNPSIIKEIYEKCKEVEFIDKIYLEERLKCEYGKLYNEGLFSVENAEEIEKGVYDAGTDFKMIITSLGAFYKENIDDYANNWNRPAISSQHFCASYIRNDMIGTAPITSICYRFLKNVK